jgi:hypothetical protein
VSNSGGKIKHDDIVVIEVMVEELKRPWWGDYRRQFAELFRQDQIVCALNVMSRSNPFSAAKEDYSACNFDHQVTEMAQAGRQLSAVQSHSAR